MKHLKGTEMDKNKLERVRGISRPHEQMWIERDPEGTIRQVYDREYLPIEKKMLYLSFESCVQDSGFTYLGEYVEFEDIREYARKRSQGYQRRNYGHSREELL